MANYKAIASWNWSSLAIREDDSSGSFTASTVLPWADDVVRANGFTITIDQDIVIDVLTNWAGSWLWLVNWGIFYIDWNVDRNITVSNAITAYNATTVLEITALNTTNTITINAVKTYWGTQSYPIKSYSSGTINYNWGIQAVTYNTAGFHQLSWWVTLNIVWDLLTTADARSDVIYCQSTINGSDKMTINITGTINPAWAWGADWIQISTTCPTDFNFIWIINWSGSPAIGIHVTNSFVWLIQGSFWIQNLSGIVSVGSTAWTSELRFKNMDINVVWSHRPINIADETPLVFENCNLWFSGWYAPRIYDSDNRIYFENNTAVTRSVEDKDWNSTYMYSEITWQPATADVRNETVYWQSGEFEWTLAVPPPNTVNEWVSTDDVVGTYVLAWDILTRLRHCSTVETTWDQIAWFTP